MRRPAILTATTTALLVLLAPGALAFDRERSRSEAHLLVGAWVVDTNTADALDPPGLLTIGGDGTLRLTDCCNAPAAGAWVPSSTRTADATLLAPWFDDDGFVGFNTIRADVVIAADGEALTATYTMDIPDRAGGSSGQLGPVTASGTRLQVEALGEPVGPLPVEPAEDAPAEEDPAADATTASPAPSPAA
jgi:hypothetical protein